MLEFMLTNNCFQFMGSNYRQKRGTSMGARWAPAYACLHLGLWEEKNVFRFSMYIDEVLMVWAGSVEDLDQFINELNENAMNISLTYTHHEKSLPFLGLNIRIENNRILTKIFCTNTVANTLLLAQSNHPRSLIQRIPTGQYLKSRRNCSNVII